MTTKTEGATSAFHKLGMPDADELVVKSRLIRFVAEEVRRRELTQKDAGDLLGLDQPNVSALMNEKLSRFSVQKLMAFVGRLGFKVSIHVEGSGIAFDVPYQHAA
ncbi:helix-turn-helix transcriptional regulator [Methylobacterium nonmethylotrophicum]|uniref:XRE family transcriptional regulator n=1 Tax=Methylobacterium nonmethylotrophicum TaxID=1141884 RepID=A0A4Z0NCD2_9HYPH|nr:helix-turn-helix transcriptional regulator [Methylobacterium nonmethylotrophicum]TGD92260.1 XRE family transcriptional regulator [Methylobacterium nonmethylotrophicum]